MEIVSDSGPIVSFARAGLLELLGRVAGTLIVPNAVYDEIAVRGAGKAGSDLPLWVRRQWIHDALPTDEVAANLHQGEREAMLLALEMKAALLVDDRRARVAASRLGVEYFGSLRVLQEARRRDLISQVSPVLDELVAAEMFIGENLYRSFLRQNGEQ